MDQYDTKIDLLKYLWVSDLYSWSSDFVLYLQDYLMDESHTLDNQYDTKIDLNDLIKCM